MSLSNRTIGSMPTGERMAVLESPLRQATYITDESTHWATRLVRMSRGEFMRFAKSYRPEPWEIVADWKNCHYPKGTHYLNVSQRRLHLSLRLFLKYVSPPSHVLDVGIFPGTWVRVVQELYPGSHITFSGVGLRLSQEFQEAMTKRGVAVSPVDLDLPIHAYRDPVASPTLPFSQERVDAVCAFEILEHLRNPFHFMSEISRVLKPGGYLFLSTNNVCYIMNVLRLLAGRTVYWHLDLLYAQREVAEAREHVREYTLHELRLLCQWYGFEVVESVFFDAAEYEARLLSPLDQIRFFLVKLAFVVPWYRPNLFLIARKSRS